MTSTAEFIAGFEGYAGRAYWDVNAWRLGYGSDTEGPDQVHVTEGMETTKARALQNLALRIPQFQQEAIYSKTGMGAATWEKLNDNQRTAITSIVYNYGRLPIVVTPSDPEKTAAAIRALQSANGGVNRARRLKEAAFYLEGVAPPQPAPPAPIQPVPVPAPPPGVIPISASSAGRRAAEYNHIKSVLDELLAERAAIEEEIADFQDMLTKIGRKIPVPKSPPPPPAILPPAQPQGIQTMFGTDWKTNIAGAFTVISAALVGAAKVVPALQPYSDLFTTIMGISGGAGLFAAKDAKAP